MKTKGAHRIGAQLSEVATLLTGARLSEVAALLADSRRVRHTDPLRCSRIQDVARERLATIREAIKKLASEGGR